MKRHFLIALGATLLFLGCKDDEIVVPDRGRTLLHILGALEADSFRVTLDYFNADDIVIDDFYHHRNFPIQGYANLEASGTPDEFGNGKLFLTLSQQPFANIAPDTIMAAREIVLERDDKATICFYDSMGTGTYIKFKDEYPDAGATFAQVRFINLAPSLATAGMATPNGTTISGVGFMAASPYQAVSAGTQNIDLLDANGNVVSTTNFVISPYTAYTFYVSGTTAASLNYYIH